MPEKKARRGVKPGARKPSRFRVSRRSTTLLIGLFVVLMVAWWWNRPRPQSNVFVLLLDTVRQDALGCYGHPADPTPRIDALTADGVRFDQAISTSGWTLPAVASLMTGTWPTIHGAAGKGVKLSSIREELPTAAEVLREAGFETIGIANAAFVSPMVGVDRGFDVFNHRYSYNFDARRADETISIALDEIRQRRSKSGFYFIHLFDAHLDYDPPAGLAGKYTGGRREPAPPMTAHMVHELQRGDDGDEPPTAEDVNYVRGLYEGEVSFIDGQVGRFIDELKSLDLYDSATIIITSDHGEEFWEHGGFEHGHTLYDELVLVLLVIKFPVTVETGARVVQSQVRLLDVMPTVFEILGVESPKSFIGKSLMRLVRGETTKDYPAFLESTLYGRPRIAMRGRRYKYIMEIARDGSSKGELYDWREDPLEKRDLSSEIPDLRAQLQEELAGFKREAAAVAAGMSQLNFVDLSPERIQQLRSLGYIR
jgi:arylsulfatase A-like enzyme